MDESFKLTKREHDRRYERIEKQAFKNTRPVEKPRVIILGGQPGSGKSKVLINAKKDFLDDNVVVINGDDLREYHPKAEDIWRLDDKRFAERTDPDSRVWTKRLFEKAIETRRNIIFESTMREAGPISETMQRLQDHGYHVTARVVATHERMSKTGIYYRYEDQKFRKGYGRFTPPESHDAGYVGMPKTVEHIEANMLAHTVEVYDRSGGPPLYENHLVNNRWQKQPGAAQAIQTERQRPPSLTEMEQFEADWQRIHKLMKDRNAPKKDIEQVKKLHQTLKLSFKEHLPERDELARKRAGRLKPQPEITEIRIAQSTGADRCYSSKSGVEDLIMLRKRVVSGSCKLPEDQRKTLDKWIDAKKKDKPPDPKKQKDKPRGR